MADKVEWEEGVYILRTGQMRIVHNAQNLYINNVRMEMYQGTKLGDAVVQRPYKRICSVPDLYVMLGKLWEDIDENP